MLDQLKGSSDCVLAEAADRGGGGSIASKLSGDPAAGLPGLGPSAEADADGFGSVAVTNGLGGNS